MQNGASISERVLKKKSWSAGKIPSDGQILMYVLWGGTLIWLLAIGAPFYKSLNNPNALTKDQIILGVVTSFGLIPLFFALRATTRWRRFGQSWCTIDGKAGVIGKKMTGKIITSALVQPNKDYELQLQCIETTTTGSGKKRKSHTNIRWQQKAVVPSAGKNSQHGIPFTFEIPSHPMETGDELSAGTVGWTLSIRAPLEGVDYSASFIVPVFRV